MKKVMIATLFATLALYGCDDSTSENGGGGDGGSAGAGGSTGGTGGGTGGGGEDGGGGGDGAGWSSFTIELDIGADLEGQILQVGFVNTASDFEGSGIFYDNLVVEAAGAGGAGGAPELILEEDFEGLDSTSATALGDTGWLRFLVVFDGTVSPPGFRFQDGPSAAPNATVSPDDTFISAVVTGEGGAEQGAQQLSVFSDYNCCDLDQPPDDQIGHGNGVDLVEISVFQEPYNFDNRIPADLVGTTLTFSFDAKRGNIEGATTAFAFIKTLDPDDGFNTTNDVREEMTDLP